jgi:hypothetical protein
MAALGLLLFLLAAFLPLRTTRGAMVRRGLGAAAVLALLPAAASPGVWPFVLLGAGAAAVGVPLALGLAAAGATVVVLSPEVPAQWTVGVAGLGTAAAAGSVDVWLRARRGAGGDPAVPALGAGLLLVVALLLADHQALLAWSFGVGSPDARVLLPGVGPVLGLGLVSGVGGVVLLGAGLLAPAAVARRAGLAVLGLAAGVTGVGLGGALFQTVSLGDALREAAADPLALLVAAAATLGVVLMEAREPTPDDGPDPDPGRPMVVHVAAGLAVAAALTAGVESWWAAGGYATDLTAAAVATACLGLAALEPERRLAGSRRALLLAAFIWLLVG